MSAPQADASGAMEAAAEPRARGEASWLAVVGSTGRRQESCARAFGVDVAEGQTLVGRLRAQVDGAPSDLREEGVSAFAAAKPVVGSAGSCAVLSLASAAWNDVVSLPTLLGHYPRLQILAFYLSPWEAFLDACGGGDPPERQQIWGWLTGWADYQQALLKARMVAPDRVFLVNAGRLDHLDGLRRRLRQMGAAIREPSGVAKSSVEAPPTSPSLSCLVAAQMAEAGREYWAIYEALESCCVLYEREPEFRATAELPDMHDLSSILVSFSRMHRTIMEDDPAVPVLLPDQTEESPDRLLEAGLPDLQRENELLVLQLHQLYEELDHHVSCAAELRQIVNDSGEAADAARRLIAQLASKVAESK